MSDFVKYEDLLDKPFELGARGPNAFDCYGLCCELSKRVGIILPEVLTPEDEDDQHKIICGTSDRDFEELETPEQNCLVTISIHKPLVDHCGFVLGDGIHFIHILKQHAVIRARLSLYKNRICGFYRLRTCS